MIIRDDKVPQLRLTAVQYLILAMFLVLGFGLWRLQVVANDYYDSLAERNRVRNVPLLAPRGSFPWGEGPYGTRDQAGSVAEWTSDAHGATDATLGYKGLSGCAEGDRCVNPRRDGSSTDARVVRGGSWRQPPFLAQSNVRDPYNVLYEPTRRFSHIGFRCARSL